MKNSTKLQNKIDKQNGIALASFDFPSQPMKSKSDRGYKEYDMIAYSDFQRVLRSNKSEVARRVEESRILSYEEQVEKQKIQNAIDAEKRAEAKRKNSTEYKLDERNRLFPAIERVREINAEKGFKFETNEKGNAVRVEIKK
jgi:predicted transglutaminase-like protease